MINEKTLNSIRWIGFVPIAFFCSILFLVVWNLVHETVGSYMGFDPNGFITRSYSIGLGHFLLGGIFIFAGVKVVPTRAKLISKILAIIGIANSLLPMIVVLLYYFESIDGWGVYSATCEVIGISLALHTVLQEESISTPDY